MGETMAVFTPVTKGKLRYTHDFNLKIAGAESNFAIGIQKLGLSAGWISKLGKDEFGQFIINTLKGEGVDVSNVSFDSTHSTGLMVKEFAASDETNVYYYRESSAASCLSANDINEEYVKGSRLIHLTGITPILNESCYEAIEKIIDIAHKGNILVSFDPNIRLKLWRDNDYSGKIKMLLFSSNIILLGLSEAKILFDTIDIETIRSLILSSENVQYLVIKDGKNGAWVGNKKEFYKIDPYKCTVIDPIGAGDAFNAGFISGLLQGSDLKRCGEIGAICGALATQSYGDFESYPSRDELENILNNTEQISR